MKNGQTVEKLLIFRDGIFSHNTLAVHHHVLAKIDPNKIDCFGEAARQTPAGTGFQPSAGKY